MKQKWLMVTPEITEEEAKEIFSHKPSFISIKIRKGFVFPRRIEMIRLPFFLFELSPNDEDVDSIMTIAVDGISGEVVFFVKRGLQVESRTCDLSCPFCISMIEAKKRALESYRWLLMEHRSPNRGKLSSMRIIRDREILYPFWVGYFQRRQALDFRAIDGVSGEFQGLKMRKVFLKAFRHMD